MRRGLYKNRKGQFFALYLLVITLFFCGFGIFMYITQQNNLESSLGDYYTLLVYYNNEELFNLQEKGLLLGWSVQNLDSFGSDEFKENVKNNYIAFLDKDTDYSQFLFSNTLFNNKALSDFSSKDIVDNFYNFDFSKDKSKFIIKRQYLVKKFFIRPDLDKAINYPVLIEDDFSNELVISKQELEKIKQGI